MTEEEKKRWAIDRLKEKYSETGEIPRKEEFDPATLSRIKAFLGPWPRALETAGLKSRRPVKKRGHPRKTRNKT